MVRPILALLTASLALVACGAQESAEPVATEEVVEAVPIAGMYEVSGVTIDKRTGEKRQISGKVILAESGSDYTSTFNLTTSFPGGDDPIGAEVIGKGSGRIDGRTLTGTLESQIVMATVPGVDPGFAFIPRTVTTRIVSESVATIAADGTTQIEIENEPAPGEEYAPTRTTLRGRRVGVAGIGSPPTVASGGDAN